jgi:acetamidase/formamidase
VTGATRHPSDSSVVAQMRPPRRGATDGDPEVIGAGGYYGTMGIHADLMQGAKEAVRGMIELVGQEHGLAPEDAYMLCSLAGDLKILEIVDAGVWNVGFTLPRSVFGDQS